MSEKQETEPMVLECFVVKNRIGALRAARRQKPRFVGLAIGLSGRQLKRMEDNIGEPNLFNLLKLAQFWEVANPLDLIKVETKWVPISQTHKARRRAETKRSRRKAKG